MSRQRCLADGRAEIVDADNLREPFVQSTHFKKLPANAPFNAGGVRSA